MQDIQAQTCKHKVVVQNKSLDSSEQRHLLAGAISETEVIVQFLALLAAGLGTAFALDKWVGHETPTLFYLAVFGSFISYIYSAPPLKLKQSGWAGNYALGSSYISLPWWAGQVGTQPRPTILYLQLLYPAP